MSTAEREPNLYPDNDPLENGIVVSWNGTYNGNEATFGVVQPCQSDAVTFRTDPRGERISMYYGEDFPIYILEWLVLSVLDEDMKPIERHVLGAGIESHVFTCQVPGSTLLNVRNIASRPLAYICEYTDGRD